MLILDFSDFCMSGPYTWDNLGFERSAWISSPFTPWGLCLIHMTPWLLKALHGISSSFIPCDYVRIGTVLKQFPCIGTSALGSNV